MTEALNRTCEEVERTDEFVAAASRRVTVVCVPLTSNTAWANAPGNVLLPARTAGLVRDSVANVSQIVTLDKSLLTERVAKLPRATLDLLLTGIDILLGR